VAIKKETPSGRFHQAPRGGLSFPITLRAQKDAELHQLLS